MIISPPLIMTTDQIDDLVTLAREATRSNAGGA